MILNDFNNIIGQEEVVGSLSNALKNDRIGHAYIFSGPAGIGKRTVAGIFGRMLICDALGASGACGGCQPCRLLTSGANPDFRIIRAEGATIGVDKIRDLQNDIIIRPMYSRRKVYIIEDAGDMTAQAQNCLLKTLEEPPKYAVLILTAAIYETLLETIRSRAQRLSFRKNTQMEVRQAVSERYPGNTKGVDFAIAYADGVIGAALEMVEAGEFMDLREKTIEMVNRMKEIPLSEIFSEYVFFEENKEDFNAILDIMTLFYRDMLVFIESGNEKLLINSDKRDIILNNVHKYNAGELIARIGHIEAARRAVKQNANFQLAVENMLIMLREE